MRGIEPGGSGSYFYAMRIACLLTTLLWCFSVQTTPAEPNKVKVAFDFIQTITIREDWSVKEVRQIAAKLTAINGRTETELVSISFPDKESVEIGLSVYSRNEQGKPKDGTDQEPVGTWSITLKKKEGAYVYEKHAWGDV